MTTIRTLLSVSIALSVAAPASAQQLLNRTVDVNGVQREYLLYVPASYSAAEAAPVMFTFHGGAMTSMDMLMLADMRPLAEADGSLLAYPQGLPGKDGSYIWNSEGPYSNGVDEMGFFEAMIDDIALDFALDQERVYACGYSNGGNLVWDLACILGHRVAAVASVAGNMFEWTYDACSPGSETAVLTIHGTADSTYNQYDGLPPYTISLPQTNDNWVQVNGAETTPSVEQVGNSTEHFTWAEGAACFSVEHYKVNGGGHDWFGAFGSSDFDSNEVIWEFSKGFSLGGKIGCGGPEVYCETSPNSNGPGALMGWSGSTSVSANDLVLEVTGAAVGKAGIFFFGPEQTQVQVGDGYLCVAGSLKRLPVVVTDGVGDAAYALDLSDPTLPSAGIAPGETWNFQFWFRDPPGNLSTYNFSDGLTVPFTP